MALHKEISTIKAVLPDHYIISPNSNNRSIRCKSEIGIRIGTTAEDDEHWNYITSFLRQRFGKDLAEIFHHTSTHHSDFTIYFKRHGN